MLYSSPKLDIFNDIYVAYYPRIRVLAMTILLKSPDVTKSIDKLASLIFNDLQGEEFYVVGIRSRGEVLGKRLASVLSEKLGTEVSSGTLDIALYRDDFDDPHGESLRAVGITDLPGDISDKVIILADDVLHTGRSCRAALDAIVDFGRPAKIRLAVLVDRGQREFPIQADYVGFTAEVGSDEMVRVSFKETDGEDLVCVVNSDED